MPDDADERRLAWAWQRGLAGPLVTTDGRHLQIVFRGRCPGGAGPDVRGALLAFDDGTLLEGDVEFHRRSSDWFVHGHDRDPRYRGVILHVVLAADGPAPLDPTGQPIPTLVIPTSRLEAADPNTAAAARCHELARRLSTAALSALLDDLGDRRLIQRAARVEAELTRQPPEQVAYAFLLDALGFSRNRSAFARLAQAVPAGLLTALMGRRPPADARDLGRAILLGAAGLLPSERPGTRMGWEDQREANNLETIWALYHREWQGIGLSASDWAFAGVRPANYPPRRIVAAAYLIERYRDRGLDQAFLTPLRAGGRAIAEIEAVITVEDPRGYWASHADFGRPLPGGPAALLGHDRAREIVINVVLPFALAWADGDGDRELARVVWDVFRRAPRSGGYGLTTRLITELGLPQGILSTARRQQGLLYLLRMYCEGAGGAACPVAQTAWRGYVRRQASD
ncbi:MAG TPA: DUF2851 family protein [Chloroflexota bacterium]|nr:DUF2851 family protein [Chloroflexota bacterium]